MNETQTPQRPGWEIGEIHRVPGGGGCMGDSRPFWRSFLRHIETTEVFSVSGASRDEVLSKIPGDIEQFEREYGFDLPLPEGWRITLSRSLGRGGHALEAAREGQLVSALGTSPLAARIELIEQIRAGATLQARRQALLQPGG